jgi:VWFA-related protein
MAAAVLMLGIPFLHAQSGQSQSPATANPQPAQEIPDAPSTVHPPAPKPADAPPEAGQGIQPPAYPGEAGQQPDQQKPAPPPMPPIETIPAGSRPRNQINPREDLYTISVSANVVQIPVLVKYSDGRPVDGLLPKDFIVKENGKVQTLTYFTSDPFQLSVAVLLDTGIADVAFQKVNQSYASLVGAFSPYDEVALYTYSSTVSQVTDYSGRHEKLTAALNQMKTVRGRNNGPPVLGGPLGPDGPTVNGAPVGGPIIQPVNTPPREAHVLNDAILRAALDLSKRDRTRRKVIFVISDGRDLGSKASYRDVLKVLETHGIQVKAVVVDSGALPVYRELDKLHLRGQGYSNILPRYVSATGGGEVFSELSRNAMEEAYAQITSEARNQYTLAYIPKAAAGPAFRSIEVQVDKKGLNIYTKAGYYPVPSAH